MSTATLPRAEVLEQLRRPVDPEEYRAIKDLWVAHSVAEDALDIPGLMATLTEDCLYTVVNMSVNMDAEWRGKDGATRFYLDLLGAFPDIDFDLQHIVIGPQGV